MAAKCRGANARLERFVFGLYAQIACGSWLDASLLEEQRGGVCGCFERSDDWFLSLALAFPVGIPVDLADHVHEFDEAEVGHG